MNSTDTSTNNVHDLGDPLQIDKALNATTNERAVKWVSPTTNERTVMQVIKEI